ncbi:hypothetical protein [Synoicihabitans lomoniglobus]|uniref:PEP-CTERM protein-sorting domain-containing protein n=1 Tax=Synoicihabitans lomoniglobus TaxID=2909285 RepID=A0AAE9ZYG9_9BACT|nr:hypothetical protein [Opitutaceae bacterium LMO-M01]WED63523.1 hypothetical protein PXH66_14390 [Opitutaceae bacterium LMO-M01]
MKKTILRRSVAVATIGFFFSAFAVGLCGQTTVFTITGQAESTNLGYVQGNTYTFSFTMNDNFANANAYDTSFDDRHNWWREELTGNDQLFLDVTSSSLSGTYQRPTLAAGDPSSEIKTDENYDSLTMTIDSNLETLSGLTSPDGTGIHMFYAQNLESDGWNLTADSTAYEVGDYFSSLDGSYSIGYGKFFMNTPSSGYIQFNVGGNSVAVSHISAVPEPSAFAAILGAAALVGVMTQRRRTKRPASAVNDLGAA